MSELSTKVEELEDAPEHNIKSESGSDLEDNDPNEPGDPESAETKANNIAQVTLQAATSYDNLQWRLCDGFEKFSLLQKIETKEIGVKDGMDALRDLKSTLVAAQDKVHGSVKRVGAVSKIIAAKRKLELTVGLLGLTGTGKSSLINAIVGFNNLLPADDGRACTAVCVQISWNPSDDPEQPFLAKVLCISVKDWRAEINALIKDINDDVQGKDGDDGEPDLERSVRIKTAFEKLICVYPHIKQHSDLITANIDDLMNNEKVKPVLGHNITLPSPNLEHFASSIRPYIDSNNQKADEGITYALWPLVKVVKLYIKSPILKDGICLVDLPGSHDTNVARGAIAAKYQKELNICCVVASAKRAASDQSAQDLLGSVQRRNMQLDNQFSTDRLCFIISMSDAHITPDRYIQTNSKLKKSLARELKNEQKAKAMEKDAKIFQSEQLDKHSNLVLLRGEKVDKRKALLKDYTILKPAYESITKKRKQGQEELPVLGQGEPLSEAQIGQASDLKSNINSLMSEIHDLKAQEQVTSEALFRAQGKLQKITNYLEHCKSMQVGACIKHRNLQSGEHIRKYYADNVKEMGKRKEVNPLRVFGVSAQAYMEMRAGKSFNGFSTLADTGIPDIHNWLIASTLEMRKINSESMLESFLSLELSITPWLADRKVGYKMPVKDRKKIQGSFQKNWEDLGKKLEILNQDATKSCKTTVQGLTKTLSKFESAAEPLAVKMVKKWPDKPMHWSTFRVINKHRGYWKRAYARKEGDELNPYDWNQELAGLYLTPLIPGWHKVIHEKLPLSRSKYLENFKDIMTTFTTDIAAIVLEICPEISKEAGTWKESSQRTHVIVHNHSADIFNTTIRDEAAATHPLIGEMIKEAWIDTYTECGSATGKGIFKASRNKHLQHIEKVKRSMYKTGSDAIRENFKKLWTILPAKFDAGTDVVMCQIMDEMKIMLDNHTLFEDDTSADMQLYKAKKQLQIDVANIFKTLRARWSIIPEFEVAEEKHVPEPEMPTLEGLYDAEREDDDDEMF